VTDEIVKRDAPGGPGNATGNPGSTGASGPNIAGISVLKGVILYGATFSFAGLHAYVITRILAASPTHPPNLDGTLVGAAAALAALESKELPNPRQCALEPSGTDQPSCAIAFAGYVLALIKAAYSNAP
jgi:hypothetical protein